MEKFSEVYERCCIKGEVMRCQAQHGNHIVMALLYRREIGEESFFLREDAFASGPSHKEVLCQYLFCMWVFPKIGVPPKMDGLQWKTLLKMDDLGGPPLFLETSMWVLRRVASRLRPSIATSLDPFPGQEGGPRKQVPRHVGQGGPWVGRVVP